MDRDERARQLLGYSHLVPLIQKKRRRPARARQQEDTETDEQRREAFDLVSAALDEAGRVLNKAHLLCDQMK